MDKNENKLIDNVGYILLDRIEYRPSLEKIFKRDNILGSGDINSLQKGDPHQKISKLINLMCQKTNGLVLFYNALEEDAQNGATKAISDEAQKSFPELLEKLRGSSPQESDVRDSPSLERTQGVQKRKVKEEDDISKQDPYNLPPTGKGLMLPINIIKFDKKKKNRNSALLDNDNILKLFPKLGWNIFPSSDFGSKTYYKKKEIKKLIQDFKTECAKTQAKSCVVFIGSHGKDGCIGTSNMEKILVNYIISRFYHGNFKFMEGKPKIFIIQACRRFKDGEDGEDEFNEFKSDEEDGEQTGEDEDEEDGDTCYGPNADTIIIKSQLPGEPAYRQPGLGSYLMHCITEVFEARAHDTSLLEMMKMVRAKVNKLKPEQMPEIKLQGEKDFYLFP